MSESAAPNNAKKDVIYVDIEDDITSIIEKVKDSKLSIVALVPPKRIGVLQSVVNLKLLNRAASHSNKRIVLITSDNALTSLAAGVLIPVARNLQTKPEIPVALDSETDEEEIITGENVPAAAASTVPSAETPKNKGFAAALRPSSATSSDKTAKKSSNVPDFDKFRKRLFLSIGAGVALILFLVWAFVIAPSATIAITANTNLVNIDQVLQLKPDATADPSQNVLPATVKQTKKSTSVDFDATGKKDVGEKATGDVKFTSDSFSALVTGITIPAGTSLTSSGGKVYTTDAAVTLSIAGNTKTVRATATERGEAYNGASGQVSGAPSSVSAAFTSATAGGTDKTITVVSQTDIDKAKQQLQSQDANTIKAELQKQFGSDMLTISESFKAEVGDATSSPAVDQETTGKAKLTSETTYSLVGIKRSDLKANFNAYLEKALDGKQDQKVYASGDNNASFNQFTAVNGGYTTKVTAQAQVGPQIDENALKKQLVDKRAGEIQQQLQSIDGIEDVNTTFFPAWITKTPSESKITIKFVLKNEAN